METTKSATKKQVSFLIELGLEPEIASSLNFRQAASAIKCKLAEPTPRQRDFLRSQNVPDERIDRLSKSEARILISAIIDGTHCWDS